jgi:hypothetical protein
MSINKLITGLTLSLLLASGMANADWGDVYYCQMTNNIVISPDGELTRYKLKTFEFKLDQSRNAMAFESDGYFKGLVSKLTEGRYWPNEESWWADTNQSLTYFHKGRLVESTVGSLGISSMTADCDKL